LAAADGTVASRPEQYPLLLELKEDPELEKPLEHVKRILRSWRS